MIKIIAFLSGLSMAFGQSYPPAAGQAGSTAIAANSPDFLGWASGIEVVRGHVNLADPNFSVGGSTFATAGQPSAALGFPDGGTVSLGDGGWATLNFAQPIVDGPGFDFAVFENGTVAYLELAFVEVSSNGLDFFRFPAHSQTGTTSQLGSFGTPQAAYLSNLAGKYDGNFGTPFDLSDLPDSPLLDKQHITQVKVIDVVGSINPAYATYDALGNAVNDSFPTPFASSGFDLQAVGVLHQLPLQTTAFDASSKIKLYPNPARTWVRLSGNFVGAAYLSDASGRMVLRISSAQDQEIDVRALRAGWYQLHFIGTNQSGVLPLLINP